MAYIRIPLKNILSVSRIVTVFRFDFAPDYQTAGESHDFWELVYVDEGELGLQGGDCLHHVTAGEMILHKPNEFHRVECDGVHAARVFIITFECRSGAMKFFYDKVLSVSLEVRSQIGRLLDECGESFHVSSYPLQAKEEAPIGSLQLIRNYLECILIRMMREGEREKASKEQFYRSREVLEQRLAKDIRAYLEAHLYERLSLERLGREFHFSVSTICNIYKRATGQTVMHTLLMLKLEEAKRLLRTENIPIAEISARLGFETPQYFSRIFCRHVGMPPRDFREG